MIGVWSAACSGPAVMWLGSGKRCICLYVCGRADASVCGGFVYKVGSWKEVVCPVYQRATAASQVTFPDSHSLLKHEHWGGKKTSLTQLPGY